MENKVEFYIKDCYICNYCRNICKGPCNDLKTKINSGEIKPGDDLYEKNKDLVTDRKIIIDCLGPYCDKPCKYQKKECTVPIDVVIRSLKFVGQKLNDYLTQNI